jgi:hypothetical protein
MDLVRKCQYDVSCIVAGCMTKSQNEIRSISKAFSGFIFKLKHFWAGWISYPLSN